MRCQVNRTEPVTEPKDVADILRSILKAEAPEDQDKEHLWVIGLRVNKRIAYVELVSLGILDSCLVHPREVFRLAIMKAVDSIIIGHNHPSGDAKPSDEDWNIYYRMERAGSILGIEVLDSVIIANRGGFVSLKQERWRR